MENYNSNSSGASKSNKRFLSSKDDISYGLNQMDNPGAKFRDIRFPLTKLQRYHLFRQMLWNYSLNLVSVEDYKLASKPKKIAATFAGIWGAVYLGLQY